MVKNTYIKIIILITSVPFTVVSLIAEKLNLWALKQDINKCIITIEKFNDVEIPNYLWEALIVAEDRRNTYHKGIDPIAILRAIFVKITKNESQGASTIEQQFVRVVSERYDRKLSRKLREQILAICITKRFSKYQIAKSYLCIAFYGAGKVGIKGIHTISNTPLENINIEQAIAIISRLKYPEPSKKHSRWLSKHSIRNQYINDKYRLKLLKKK